MLEILAIIILIPVALVALRVIWPILLAGAVIFGFAFLILSRTLYLSL